MNDQLTYLYCMFRRNAFFILTLFIIGCDANNKSEEVANCSEFGKYQIVENFPGKSSIRKIFYSDIQAKPCDLTNKLFCYGDDVKGPVFILNENGIVQHSYFETNGLKYGLEELFDDSGVVLERKYWNIIDKTSYELVWIEEFEYEINLVSKIVRT